MLEKKLLTDQGHPTDLFLKISVLMESPAGYQEKGTDKFTFYNNSYKSYKIL